MTPPMIPCEKCTDKICVPGRGNNNADLVFVGEAPGREEVLRKPPMCWIGKAGQELENYITRSGILVDSCYLTNLVKCHPTNDRDPTQEEIASCSKLLEQEIAAINPKYIACLGAISTKYFLGNDVTLERIHGIPVEKDGRIILPMYHPAAGLHNSTMMVQILYDFEVLGRLVRGKVEVGSINDKYKDCDYYFVEDREDTIKYLNRFDSSIVAIDTESVKLLDEERRWYGKTYPWCISLSLHPGTGITATVTFNDECIKVIQDKLSDPRTLTLIHNSMYDLPILSEMGIVPAKFVDTMVMAYLTQSLPQGLKDLAYRLQGMEMKSYDEMVQSPSELNALRYLAKVGGEEWPDPEPELVWSKGEPHVRKGWALHKRVGKIFKQYDKGEEVDLVDRWYKIEEELRLPAEMRFGLLPIGDLSEIDIDEAVWYACRDADATYRVYPDLEGILRGMNIATPNREVR